MIVKRLTRQLLPDCEVGIIDPISAIVGGVSNIVDVISGAPQARAAAAQATANAQVQTAALALETERQKTDQIKQFALYGGLGIALIGGLYIVSKMVT